MLSMTMSFESSRLLAAATTLLVYAMMCAAIWWQHRQRRLRAARGVQAMPQKGAADGHAPILIAYGSQTGSTEALAWQTARSLGTAGVSTRVLSLNGLSLADLTQAGRALFLVSTYGEGDSPDNAALFVQRVMGLDATSNTSLRQLQFALLALGDREYKHFCGFGHELDRWLRQQGAQPWGELIEVDNGDEAALSRWRQQLSHIAGVSDDVSSWDTVPYQAWTLSARQHLNPGSQGRPTFHVVLKPAQGQSLPSWEAGDLIQLVVPGHEDRPREYSIASLPQDGAIELLVRQAMGEDQVLGLASGWLTAHAPLGAEVQMRVRAHGNFRIGDNAQRPLILIGNGTGLAGLRAHLKASIARGEGRRWLLFGERQAAHDFYHRDELLAWQAAGQLKLDLAFSRDQAERVHVQHLIRREHLAIKRWLTENGAAIYVCGSLEGMAGAVHEALQEILGQEVLDEVMAQGRYRRDVY